MTATFIFERFTKVLEIPITANTICSEFDWEPRSFHLLIRSEQPSSGQIHIQPTGGYFSNLKDEATYEIILSQQKCTFAFNEERFEEDVSKATQLYLAERFNLKPETVILNDGNKDILALNGRFRDLRFGQIYKVNGEPYNSSRQAVNKEEIKIQIRVPEDFINDLRGSLINNFQNYSHLNRYRDLDNLLENSEATLLHAKEFQSYSLKLKDGDTQKGFDTFYTAVIEINKAEHEAFLTADRGLSEMKRELTALPLALLDTIAIPSHFINNREKIRTKMQKAIEEKIEATRVLLEKTIAEIIEALDKPKMLAEKLSDIIHSQVTEEATRKSKATVKQTEIKLTITQLDESIKDLEKWLEEENLKLATAKERLRNAEEMKEGWFSGTKDQFKATENIELHVLIAFLHRHLLVSLPDINEIDAHKTVYLEDLQEVLKGVDPRYRVVPKLHEYAKFLAMVSTPMSQDNHTKLQKLREELVQLEKEPIKQLAIPYDDGTPKENQCRNADRERQIAEETIKLLKELIRKKKDRKIRTERTNRELLEIINATSTTTRARELSDKICRHLDNIKRLFASIISALKETQGHIKSNLRDKFDSYLSTMNLDILYTSETDARQQLELWYREAIQAIGWIVQVATTCNVFGKLYAEVIEPGLKKNGHALYTGTKLNEPTIRAVEIINSITQEAPRNVAAYINDINKPLNVYVKFLTNGEERPQLQEKESLVEELEEGAESEREI